jgi:hypothetical protein
MFILSKDELIQGFKIQPNTLINDDCLNAMKFIPDGSISMILADPPYGTTACKWDAIIPLEPMWEQLKRVIKPNGAIVIFGAQPFTSILICSNLKMYRYDWVWEKDKGANWMFGNKQPLKVHENVSVFYSNQPNYLPQKTLNPNGESKRHLSKNPSKITGNVKDVMGVIGLKLKWMKPLTTTAKTTTQRCFYLEVFRSLVGRQKEKYTLHKSQWL